MAPALLALTVSFVARWEGFCARTYVCPAGFVSIGYGTRRYPDGRPVVMGDPPVTEAQAQLYLQASLMALAQATMPLLTAKPNDRQAAALLSLAYNIGGTAFAHSTLLRKFNAGDRTGAAEQFFVWDKAHVNGALVALPGLAARRAAERALFLS